MTMNDKPAPGASMIDPTMRPFDTTACETIETRSFATRLDQATGQYGPPLLECIGRAFAEMKEDEP
jgi:hypothetical protein